jgi:hypothetical protein
MYDLQMTRGVVLSILKAVAKLTDGNNENSQIDEVVFDKACSFYWEMDPQPRNVDFGNVGLYIAGETHFLID